VTLYFTQGEYNEANAVLPWKKRYTALRRDEETSHCKTKKNYDFQYNRMK
jgi:hypothetical protein